VAKIKVGDRRMVRKGYWGFEKASSYKKDPKTGSYVYRQNIDILNFNTDDYFDLIEEITVGCGTQSRRAWICCSYKHGKFILGHHELSLVSRPAEKSDIADLKRRIGKLKQRVNQSRKSIVKCQVQAGEWYRKVNLARERHEKNLKSLEKLEGKLKNV